MLCKMMFVCVLYIVIKREKAKQKKRNHQHLQKVRILTMALRVQRVALLLLIFLFLQTKRPYFCKATSSISCSEIERESLLAFKATLTDPANRLSSWMGENCCSWRGVSCNNDTGHVLRLDLHTPTDDSEQSFGGEMNSSLLHLKHLTHLDLSGNDFNENSIPEFLGSFKSLVLLNLSLSDFGGVIPHQLGNLSSLRKLDLYGNSVVIDDSRWLSRLISLQYLDLSYAAFQQGSNWLRELNKLPSLRKLLASQCLFAESLPLSLPVMNFTSLSVLDLSNGYFNTTMPAWFFNITSLEYLNLGGNFFRVFIPDSVGGMTLLKFLDLSGNYKLEGGLPISIGKLCNMKSLRLSWTNISADIASFAEVFSGCIRNSIEELYMDGTQLRGSLPEWLGNLHNLKSLDLASNSISGPIPVSFGKLSSLESLRVAANKLNGTVPENLGALSKLVDLNLNDNLLAGNISEVHFANLSRLENMDLSENSLALNVSSNWIPPFKLKVIRIRDCKLGPQFPPWLRTQVNFTFLDISNAGISDHAPHWFWTLSSRFSHLNLSHNEISGEVPSSVNVVNSERLTIDLSSNCFQGPLPLFSPWVGTLDVSNNSFSGEIPANIGEKIPTVTFLALSKNNLHGSIPSSICKIKNLAELDVSKNQLSGELPNCWQHSPDLRILDSSNNNLIGSIPASICSIVSMWSLHLGNNNLSGEFPLPLKSCKGITTLDLSHNQFSGKIPIWIGERLPKLMILSLRANMFIGQIPPQLSLLSTLQILDLSQNNLSGIIPPSLGNLTAMRTPHKVRRDILEYSSYVENLLLIIKGKELSYDKLLSLLTTIDLSENSLSGHIPEDLTSLHGLYSLNLSGNHITGHIIGSVGRLTALESLDLSRNGLEGFIPPTLSELNFLSHLNLSYNNLAGKIPSGNQLQTLTDPSIYIGNRDLCGFPLSKSCQEDGENTDDRRDHGNDGTDKEDDADENEMLWFYGGMGAGIGVGFWLVWGILLFKRSWRYAYFESLDEYVLRMITRW